MSKFLFILLLSIISSFSFGGNLKGKQILYIQRDQYLLGHHNSETMFQVDEINTKKFTGGSSMCIYDVDTNTSKTLLESKNGVIRDPELSYDAKKIIFSMRKDIEDFYHIYEIDIDGSNLRQITTSSFVSDIDPAYLPDGDIIFSSTREPKYCMCNRHIMANLFRMKSDGSNIEQIGVSTLFEGHAFVMDDGKILYDRWEYVDRNFGDAQGLWTVNPDGTRHSIYYGNNMASPGGVIDARQIPDTDLVVCIFTSTHDRPWGALAIIDRKLGVDGEQSVLNLLPESSRKFLNKGNYDSFKWIEYHVEDPFPIDRNNFLVSLATRGKDEKGKLLTNKSDIYTINVDGTKTKLISATKSLFDPMIIQPRKMPPAIPSSVDNDSDMGTFYVQNVYEGTHMKGVKKGEVKYLRVIETPQKRSWTKNAWNGQGQQAPGVNWSNFETKRIIGEATVEEDGSTSFKAPSGKFIYFQLLDKDKKMIQSMRSGTMLMDGEIYGCVGCHENRLAAPMTNISPTKALKKPPQTLQQWLGKEPETFSYMKNVQPILDKYCVDCHDTNSVNYLVLSKDKNMYFNASYINMYVSGVVNLIGGGPAETQQAKTWGSNASLLTELIEASHNGIEMTTQEKEMLYTWLDLNGPYYPTYETSFDNVAGRSPLTANESKALGQLTGLDFAKALNTAKRKLPAQIYFDRPEKSPCLELVKDKDSYNKALEIIKKGAERLKETPRGDIENEIVILPKLQKMLDKYDVRIKELQKSKDAIKAGKVYHDSTGL